MRKNWFLIVAALFLFLVLARCSLDRFYHKPLLTFIARFRDIPPVGQNLVQRGIGVFYRGFRVGRVYKIDLSEDQNYVIFYIAIERKNLKLARNTRALLRTQSVLGDKFISLDIPFKPSPQTLTNGDVIEGRALVEDVGEIILTELGPGNTRKLLLSITGLSENMNAILNNNKTEVNQILKELAESGCDVSEILKNIREIAESPQTKNDIRSTLRYSSKSAKKINEIVERKELGNIITGTPMALDEAVKSVKSVNMHISKTTEDISKTTEDISRVTQGIPETINTFKTTAKTYDCLGKGISEMLSKRFLVFRLLFGAPGSNLEKCKNNCKKNQ